MLPASALIAHLVRQSGKSVLTRTSITPHAWAANAPTCLRPIASRTPLRAPSHPTTYFARTVRSSPARVAGRVPHPHLDRIVAVFVDGQAEELDAVVGNDPAGTVRGGLGEVVQHPRLVDDEVRELADLERVVLGARRADDVLRVLGVGPPEVHVRDVVRLGHDALGETERLEGLDAARLDAVGLPEHEPAVAPLDDARRDPRELRHLRREQHARGARSDDEHVHLVGQLGRPVEAGAGRVLHAGLSRDVSVVMELHGCPPRTTMSRSASAFAASACGETACSIFEHIVLLLNRSYTFARRQAHKRSTMTDGAAAPASQTLSRGIRILEILADAREPLSIDEIARRLGVHRSVAYRLLRTLEDHGLVTRDAAGRIQLGARMAALAAGRRARPAGRGAPRAHRGRERARHDVLPRRARPRRVRHARERRAAPRGRLGRAAAGDAASGHASAHPARRSCRCSPRRRGPPRSRISCGTR